jgi:3-phenylpropionate/cinnamic acid dioxygenase small subunit
MTSKLERWHAVQEFLFVEARMIDERRWDDWLELFTPDAEYWVPQAWQQENPRDHVSLFHETVQLLRMRTDRLERDLAPLEWPRTRTNHHLTNITVEDDTGGGVEFTARAYLVFAEYRRDELRWFSARSSWQLRPAGETFRIAAKRVDLLNADQTTGHLRFAIPF